MSTSGWSMPSPLCQFDDTGDVLTPNLAWRIELNGVTREVVNKEKQSPPTTRMEGKGEREGTSWYYYYEL